MQNMTTKIWFHEIQTVLHNLYSSAVPKTLCDWKHDTYGFAKRVSHNYV